MKSLSAKLLDRDPDPVPGPSARDFVSGRTVLVTGAGGSIGGELVRQLERLSPSRIYLLDRDETLLHARQLEFRGHGLLNDDRLILADIRDRSRMMRVMQEVRPAIVLHAAAHKHLPLLERYPGEGVKTNVLGTANVVAAASSAGVEAFVNVSTDKASDPTSVLGATKRIAEMVVAASAGGAMRVASVRFGNVLGSRGSLLESLAHQVRSGHRVTVTDSDATRFFMTIPQAACLVLEAAAMADGGETYVLDMGEPVGILDLVHRYLSVIEAGEVEIVITGLRKGEKLHESLVDGNERALPTSHPLITRIEAERSAAPDILVRADALYAWCQTGDDVAVLEALERLLPRLSQPGVPSSGDPGYTDPSRAVAGAA